MDQINENISRNLRDLRKDKGLTLDELADLTGVSKSMLGEIERGGTNPTILTLWKIADGLKIPLTSLISAHQPDYTLVRGDRLEALSRTNAYEIRSVFPYYAAHKNEILHLKIAPRGRLTNEGHLNGVDEVIYVHRRSSAHAARSRGDSFAHRRCHPFQGRAGARIQQRRRSGRPAAQRPSITAIIEGSGTQDIPPLFFVALCKSKERRCEFRNSFGLLPEWILIMGEVRRGLETAYQKWGGLVKVYPLIEDN